jgi:hypothetical protein
MAAQVRAPGLQEPHQAQGGLGPARPKGEGKERLCTGQGRGGVIPPFLSGGDAVGVMEHLSPRKMSHGYLLNSF